MGVRLRPRGQGPADSALSVLTPPRATADSAPTSRAYTAAGNGRSPLTRSYAAPGGPAESARNTPGSSASDTRLARRLPPDTCAPRAAPAGGQTEKDAGKRCEDEAEVGRPYSHHWRRIHALACLRGAAILQRVAFFCLHPPTENRLFNGVFAANPRPLRHQGRGTQGDTPSLASLRPAARRKILAALPRGNRVTSHNTPLLLPLPAQPRIVSLDGGPVLPSAGGLAGPASPIVAVRVPEHCGGVRARLDGGTAGVSLYCAGFGWGDTLGTAFHGAIPGGGASEISDLGLQGAGRIVLAADSGVGG
jgi:hypothetical protein